MMNAPLHHFQNAQNKPTTAVIIQPMFFPWRGQFDLLSRADVIILLDNVQYVKRHWYNRNLIAGENGAQWITVPVMTKGRYHQNIQDVEIDDTHRHWRDKILNALKHTYSHAPFFDQYFDEVEQLIMLPWKKLAAFSEASLRFGLRHLQQTRTILRASDLAIEETDPVRRLIALCEAARATRYLSGPAAKDYIGEGNEFQKAGIQLEWMDYSYSPYPQRLNTSDKELSILDLLFNTGPRAWDYIFSPESSVEAVA